MVDHLLQTGANVHARDDGGLIPLHNACSFGHSEVRLHNILMYSSEDFCHVCIQEGLPCSDISRCFLDEF